MKKRTGRETFLQIVGKIFADKAPSFYFVNMSTEYDRYIGGIISDVMNELTGDYRTRIGLISTNIHNNIFGDESWKIKGFRVDLQHVERHGPTAPEVLEAVRQLGSRNTLPKDRLMVVYSTTNDSFTKSNGQNSGFRTPLLDYNILDTIDEEVKAAKPRIDQVRINFVSAYDLMETSYASDCSVVVKKVDGIPLITFFGTKDDEVYTFAYRDGTYEPISISNLFQPFDRLEYVKSTEYKREYFTRSYDEYDINPLLAYSHNISKGCYYSIPTYVEEFTLLDAANTPLDELLKLAANVENGLTVFCNSQTNPKSDDIVEEAGKAWREGKYVSLTDSIQPGFSRSGTFMYKSEKLKDLAVISYNLLLEKEKS